MDQMRNRSILAAVCVAVAVWAGSALRTSPVRAQGQAREFTITSHNYAFTPPRIEVRKDDLVKITFQADDIAHSFTLDAYRIAKRAGAGQSVVFEFRADQAGTHRFYCSLTQDDRCRKMEGQLVVR